MLSIHFIGRSYTPEFEKSCFVGSGSDGTGPYDTYDAAKAACDSSLLCIMFYKDLAEKYYTCNPESSPDNWDGFTLFILG